LHNISRLRPPWGLAPPARDNAEDREVLRDDPTASTITTIHNPRLFRKDLHTITAPTLQSMSSRQIVDPLAILILEDHADTRVVLSGLLRHCGHRTISSHNITDALEMLTNIRFDVFLSDLGLPDGDGLKLVTKAKALQPHLQTMAITGRASEAEEERGRRAGFDYYFTKPFDFHEVRVAIDECKARADDARAQAARARSHRQPK
jgi:CheY-like chemotaxis protein